MLLSSRSIESGLPPAGALCKLCDLLRAWVESGPRVAELGRTGTRKALCDLVSLHWPYWFCREMGEEEMPLHFVGVVSLGPTLAFLGPINKFRTWMVVMVLQQCECT